jgi:AraC-like DNA-binding protein
MLRIGSTIGVPEVLRDLGADPSEVLAEIGIDLSLFDDPNNLISFVARGHMIAHCSERTACPHFGLLVGQRSGLSSFGLMGLLAKYSTDVGAALRSLERFMHLHTRGARISVTSDSGMATLAYQIYHARTPGSDQVGEGAVAVAFNTMRDLCGADWKPIEVRFANRKPANIQPYRHFFQASLRFDTDQYAVLFSASWLSRRLSDTNPELLRLLQQEINKLEVQQGDNFLDHVRSLLRATLVTGHSSADEVAALLSMNRRTLNRHLNFQGTNFRKVTDEIRFEIARQLLADSAMEILQIALFLGYSNESAFTRAFRRWSATTPAKWRMMATNGTRNIR